MKRWDQKASSVMEVLSNSWFTSSGFSFGHENQQNSPLQESVMRTINTKEDWMAAREEPSYLQQWFSFYCCFKVTSLVKTEECFMFWGRRIGPRHFSHGRHEEGKQRQQDCGQQHHPTGCAEKPAGSGIIFRQDAADTCQIKTQNNSKFGLVESQRPDLTAKKYSCMLIFNTIVWQKYKIRDQTKEKAGEMLLKAITEYNGTSLWFLLLCNPWKYISIVVI